MNKLLLTAGIAMTTLFGASAMIPQTVQGRPYAPAKGKVSKAWGPDPIPIVDFDFADIQAWAGEGDKKCAFVIQWSDDDEDNALMFGYRWSGEATGTDVAKAVVEMHPKLFGAFTDDGPYGTTIDGFGWDGNDDGVFSVTLKDGSVVEPGANGFMQGGAAGYDESYATDAGDRWHGGWYEGYWSYWTCNPGDENFSYSQVGASSRKLEDGCIDGWIFAPDLQTSTWKEWVAAPLPGLALGQKFGDGTFKYVVTSVGAHPELEVESIINKNLNKAVKVPQSITEEGVEYTVTSIGNTAFKNSKITGVTLPSTIRTIGEEAFYNCENMSKFVIPEGVTEIGYSAFQGMKKLTTIDIPESMVYLDEYLFYNCTALRSVTGAENINKIGMYAFAKCQALTSLEGLSKVTIFGDWSFWGCSALEVLPEMPMLEYVGGQCLRECYNLKYFVFPVTIKENSIYEIFYTRGSEHTLLYSCASIPNEQTGVYTFAYGKDESKPYLEDGKYCTLYVPYGCSDAYTKDMPWSFCPKSELTPKAKVSEMNAEPLDGSIVCSMRVVNDGVEETDVPDLFLKANDFTSFNNRVASTFEYQYRKKGDNAFLEAAVTVGDNGICSATLNNLAAGEYEYRWTNGMKAGDLDPMITTDWQSFEVEESSVKVGDTVTDHLFKYTVTSTGDVCEVEATQFLRPGDAINVVMVPQVTIEGTPYDVTSIGGNLFSSTPITGITFPRTLRSIGSYAFSNCSGIESLNLPAALEVIGERAFQEMSKLTEAYIPNSITEIPNNAFTNCSELVEVKGAENVTRIGVSAFMNCGKLSTINGCANVTKLDRFALYGCSSLETLPVMTGLQEIGNAALGNCMALKYVIFPESIKASGLTEVFGAKGNLETLIYSCAETPAKQTGIYTLALGKDKTKPYLDDGIYGTIYVPYGKILNYNVSPWNFSTIKQLTPKIALDEMEENLDHDILNCSLVVVNDGIEETDVPELFLNSNDFMAAAVNVAGKLDFQYRKTGENALFESPVTTADDNSCSVEVRDLPLGKYEYRWTNEMRAANGDPKVTTEWKPFEVTVKSGVDRIEAEAGGVEYYTLQGIRVCNPEPGIYLKRKAGKVTKVRIHASL
jgi:hypothetical protein